MTQLYRSLSAVANPHRCLDSPNAATGQGAWLKSLDMSQKKKKKKKTSIPRLHVKCPRQTTPMWLYFTSILCPEDRILWIFTRIPDRKGVSPGKKRGEGKKRPPLSYHNSKTCDSCSAKAKAKAKPKEQLEPCLSF